MPVLFDTHAHLNSPDFAGEVDAVVDRARQAGLVGIAVIGIDATTSRIACELAARHRDFLHAVVGIQPNSVASAEPGDWDVIVRLASDGGVRGIGETGLDCHWDDTPLDQQIDYFDRHIDLCLQRQLPMVIHMRQSCDLIIDRLRHRTRLPHGVMHSFTGTADQARQCLDLGLHISFAGMVTFKKSDELREVARQVPTDRLLIETDSPYLSPEPFRGRRPNEPARVIHVLRCLANVRGVSEQDLAAATTDNAVRLFQLR